MKEKIIRAIAWKKNSDNCPACQSGLAKPFICIKCGIVEYNEDRFLEKTIHKQHQVIRGLIESDFKAENASVALYVYALLFKNTLFDDDMSLVANRMPSIKEVVKLVDFCKAYAIQTEELMDIIPWIKELHDCNFNKPISKEWLCDYTVEAATACLKERARVLARKVQLTPEEEMELIELSRM